MTAILWMNGEFIPGPQAALPVHDSAITTGIGVFDTMLARDGKLIYGHDHYKRLMHDALAVMGLTPALGEDQFFETAEMLLKKNNLATGAARVRTTITGGVAEHPLAPCTMPSLFMGVGAVPETFPPVHAWIISGFPRIAGCTLENCKRLDYTRSYAARRAAEKLGGNDALITNTNGMVVCASTSNLFIVEDGKWFTPPLGDGALYGITRKHVMVEKHAREESMLPERVLKADAIYLSNSISGLRSLSSLNGQAYEQR
jgi:branched-subunit amino acid aminotransferase/4-amino-4-deoxychorismate lyase